MFSRLSSGISKRDEFAEFKEQENDISKVNYWSTSKFIRDKITLDQEEIAAIKVKVEARSQAKEKLKAKIAHLNKLSQPKCNENGIEPKYQIQKFKPNLKPILEKTLIKNETETKNKKISELSTKEKIKKVVITGRDSKKYIRYRHHQTEEEALAKKLINEAKKELKAKLEAKEAHLNKLATPKYINKKYVAPEREIPTFQPNLNYVREQVSKLCRPKKSCKNLYSSRSDPIIEENYWRKVKSLFSGPSKNRHKLARPKFYEPKHSDEIKPTRSPYVLSILRALTKSTSGSFRDKQRKHTKRNNQFYQLRDLYLRKPELQYNEIDAKRKLRLNSMNK